MNKKKTIHGDSLNKKKLTAHSTIAPFVSTPQPVSALYSIQLVWDGGQAMRFEWDPDIPPKAVLRSLFESGAYLKARDTALEEMAAATGLRILMVTP